MTLAIIGSIMPVIIFSVLYGRMMKDVQKKVQDSKAYISTLAEETFSNIRTVKGKIIEIINKAFATEEEETAKFGKGNNEVY